MFVQNVGLCYWTTIQVNSMIMVITEVKTWAIILHLIFNYITYLKYITLINIITEAYCLMKLNEDHHCYKTDLEKTNSSFLTDFLLNN